MPAEKRATTEKGSERAEWILECAKDVLVEDGFAGLSFRSLAKRAGINVGHVTYYYPSKDDLMTALADYIFDRWERRFQKNLPATISHPAEILRYSVRFMIEENKREKSRTLLLGMWAMASHNPAVAAMMVVFYERMQAWVRSIVAELNPGLTERQQYLRAGLITAQIEGLMVLIAPGRPSSMQLMGLEDAAVVQIERLATDPDLAGSSREGRGARPGSQPESRASRADGAARSGSLPAE